MGQSSLLGYWEFAPTSAFNDSEPVSPACTQRLINNLNHLYDEQFQHRVNWGSAGVNLQDNIGLSTGAGTIQWEAVVPWTMTREQMPANVDVRVAIATSNASNPTSVQLKMVPWWGSFEEPPGNVFFASATVTTTSTTGFYALDAQQIFAPAAKEIGLLKNSIREFKTVNADDETLVARVPMVRFVARAINNISQPYIMGVLIREFA